MVFFFPKYDDLLVMVLLMDFVFFMQQQQTGKYKIVARDDCKK